MRSKIIAIAITAAAGLTAAALLTLSTVTSMLAANPFSFYHG